MFEDSFVRRSGQGRLLLVNLVFVVIGLAALVLWWVEPVTANLVALAVTVALGVASFASVALLVRCPRCGLRLGWRALRDSEAGSWLKWLLTLRACPSCGYSP